MQQSSCWHHMNQFALFKFEWSFLEKETELRGDDRLQNRRQPSRTCFGRWILFNWTRKNNPPLLRMLNIIFLFSHSSPLRVLPETMDPPVFLAPPAPVSTCLPSLAWAKPRSPPIPWGTWGPTRPPETSVSTTPRSTPPSSRSTTRLRTSAAPRDPGRTLPAPAETWSCATLTGRAVSDNGRNWSNWGEMMKQTEVLWHLKLAAQVWHSKDMG